MTDETEKRLLDERAEFINKTIRMLNSIEGKITSVQGRPLDYIRAMRTKLENKIEEIKK